MPLASARAFNDLAQKNGRHVGTRTPDLYRVKNEVTTLKPFACFAFPHFACLETPKLDEFW